MAKSLHEFLEEKEQTERTGFMVTDDSSANWALRKIAQLEKQKQQNNALAVEEIEKIEAWNKQANDEAQQSIDYFQGLLGGYAMLKREENPKFKSLKLPNGRIRFTKQQPEWKIDDETAISSLEEMGADNLIKVTKKPKLADIKKRFENAGGKAVDPETGEVVEGIFIKERPDKFSVVIEE